MDVSKELLRLKMLRILHRIYLRSDTRDSLNGRLYLHRAIEKFQEGGKILVVESGMDCDGVRYWGRTHECDANWRAFDKLWNNLSKWADGPFSLEIVRPSTVVEYGSRDLTLEAFENGHPHSIH